MTMSAEYRRQLVLSQEGEGLRMVGAHGVDHAVEVIRGIIDGQMNALMRTEGAEAAARFAFQLADRVAGNIRAPTDFSPLVPPKTGAVIIEPPAPKPSRSFFTAHDLACLIAWGGGLITGLIVGLGIGSRYR